MQREFFLIRVQYVYIIRTLFLKKLNFENWLKHFKKSLWSTVTNLQYIMLYDNFPFGRIRIHQKHLDQEKMLARKCWMNSSMYTRQTRTRQQLRLDKLLDRKEKVLRDFKIYIIWPTFCLLNKKVCAIQ